MFFHELLINPEFQSNASANFGISFVKMATLKRDGSNNNHSNRVISSYAQISKLLIRELVDQSEIKHGIRRNSDPLFTIKNNTPENLTKLIVEMLAGLHYSSLESHPYSKLLQNFTETYRIIPVGLRNCLQEAEGRGMAYLEHLPHLPLQDGSVGSDYPSIGFDGE